MMEFKLENNKHLVALFPSFWNNLYLLNIIKYMDEILKRNIIKQT